MNSREQGSGRSNEGVKWLANPGFSVASLMMAVKVLWPMLRRTNGRFAMLSGCGCPVHNAVKKSLSTVMVWSLQHEKDRCGRKDNIQSNEIYVKITYQRKIERMPLLAPEAAVAEQLSCDVWFVSTYVRLCLCLHVR